MKNKLTIGSLFAGIGGFELAATWAQIKPIWSNEIDEFACKVLNKNFNHEIIQKDIREIGAQNLKRVDIISGGFPCQPFSQAGERKGTDDNRYLWPEMLRIIREIQPSYVIGENVVGLLNMENGETLKRILNDLENEGYNNEIFIIPSASIGTWHKRERIWIYSNAVGRRPQKNDKRLSKKDSKFKEGPSNYFDRYASTSWFDRYPDNGSIRKSDGIPNRMDRFKSLGNAIVPQVAYEILKAITKIENND